MTILGNIAHRLKTDIGENLRASIDIDYSTQLTKDRFNRKTQSAKDKKESDIRIETRQNDLADEAKKQITALQLSAGNKLFETAQDTGEWGGFLNYVDNTPNLLTDVSDYLKGLANAQGTRSLDGLRLEETMKVNFRKQTQAEQKAALDRDKYNTDIEQFNAELQLKNEKLSFEQMQNLRETNQTKNNRNDMIRFIEITPDIESEEERTAFLTRLKSSDSSPAAVNKVWDEIMARFGNRLAEREKNHRNRVTARALKPPITTDPGKFEQEFAAQALSERLPDVFKKMDKPNQEKMANFVAAKMNELSRSTSGLDQTDIIIGAIAEAEKGIRNDGTTIFFGLIDTSDEVFSIARAAGNPPPGTKEEDIATTMQENNMTRDQVIDALWRKLGK